MTDPKPHPSADGRVPDAEALEPCSPLDSEQSLAEREREPHADERESDAEALDPCSPLDDEQALAARQRSLAERERELQELLEELTRQLAERRKTDRVRFRTGGVWFEATGDTKPVMRGLAIGLAAFGVLAGAGLGMRIANEKRSRE